MDILHNPDNLPYSVDWNHHHGVELHWFEGTTAEDQHKVPDLTPEDALDLASKLTQAANHAQAQRLEDLIRGDCPTCKNTRMVNEPYGSSGNTHRVHCPHCGRDAVDVAKAIAEIPTWGRAAETA